MDEKVCNIFVAAMLRQSAYVDPSIGQAIARAVNEAYLRVYFRRFFESKVLR